ncbi:SlyX protein [Coraliomargarita sinensis]|uniref:SlyX protein n=1 Tax=Coraliomargarita sinensis TaxID=2174842 RepID=A0A317ZMM6_9BACT|nr:SlyX family protein [Coraliomargarita sinensis]PXA04651.1 SlyX protein [Coraliomargarita sinensis]
MQEIDELKAAITQLEKHIESQDVEVYWQQRTIDILRKQLNKMEERIESLEQSGGAGQMQPDEKPPHY